MSAEAVDSIVADLIVRGIDEYEARLARMKRAHEGALPSLKALGEQSVVIEQAAQRYKQGSDQIAQAEEKSAQRITRARKSRSDTAKKADSDEAASAKATADAVAAAEKQKQAAIAASERAEARFQAQQTKRAQNRYYAMGPQMFEARAKEAWATDAAARAARPVRQLDISSPVLTRAAGFENGKNPFQAAADAFGGSTAAQNAEMRATTAALAEKEAAAAQDLAKAQREVNHAKLDQFDIQRRLTVAEGATKAELAQQVEWLRRIETYKRGGLTETQAQLRAEKEIADMQAVQAEAEAIRARAAPSRLSGIGRNALRFGEGAGLGRSFGSTATAAGVGFAITGAAALEGISSSVDFAKQIKDTADATGLTTRQVQIYSAAAKQAGVSTDQFRSGLGELNANLGKAKLGDEQTGKAFKALGINIKAAGSAGEVLPTIIDRLSKISDPAQRAAIETRLFGEEGRRLDSLLSGGNQKINDLADALIKTGAVLSSSDIQKLSETSQKLAEVKAQLQVDLAQVVAGNADAITSLAGAIGALTGEVLRFLGSNPGAALGIIGALGGGAVGGLPGAAIGAVAGYATGEHLNQVSADQNTDVKFRRAQLKAALDDYNALKVSASGGVAQGDTKLPLGLGNLHRSTSQAPNGGTLESLGDEVKRQAGLLDNAVAKARAARGKPDGDAFNQAVQKGQSDAAALAKLFAPKGPKGKSAETLQKEEEARQRRFNDQLADANARYLKAANDLSYGSEAQFKYQEDAIKAERDKRDADYRSQERSKQIDAGKAKELVAANDAAAAEQLKVVALQRQVDAYNRLAASADRQYSFQAEILSIQGAFADTSKQRLENAQKQIDLEEQQTKARAFSTIFSIDPKVSDADREAAADDYRNAGTLADAQRAAARRQNETPGQQYARSLKLTPDTIQSSEVKILEDFNNGLDQSVSKALKLHGIFGDIVNDLIDMAVKQALIAPLANSLFPTNGSGGSAAGGLFGTLGHFLGIGGKSSGGSGIASLSSLAGLPSTSDLSLIAGLPGFASGGGGVIGGNAGVDRNLLSINGQPVARVGKGEMLSISPNGVNGNARAAAPQQGATNVYQTIQYQGAVDVADKAYVQQIAALQHQATKRAIVDSGKQTLAATPAVIQRKQTLGS